MSRTVQQYLNTAREFEPAVVEAVKTFRRSKAWRGTTEERIAKFTAAVAALAAAYEMEKPPSFRFEPGFAGERGGCYDQLANEVVLTGKLSVVTLFHVFCYARRQPRREAFAWSINLFAQLFPISFARCRHVGPFLINDGRP
jgi:hypothetical protein